MNIQELVANYKIDKAGELIVRQVKMVFMCGITAAGKDTLLTELIKKRGYYRLISHTTRAPRYNDGVCEKDGVDYHFVSPDKMAQLLIDHKMVEVNDFGGKYYGTSLAEIEKANASACVAISDIDVNGFQSFYRIAPDNVMAIFVVPPDYDAWLSRLKKRHDSNQGVFTEVINERVGIAMQEIKHALSSKNYYFIVNDNLGKTVQELDKIIQRASRGKKVDDFGPRRVAEQILQQIKLHS